MRLIRFIIKSLTPMLRPFKPVLIKPIALYYRRIHPDVLKNALSIFVYHDISDEPREFSRTYQLNVPPALFDYQIRFIKNHFNIISPDDLLESRIPPKAALITFDDGFRSFFTDAVPVLEKHKVPTIIFLNMEVVKGKIFWSGLITYLCEKKEDFREYLKSSLSKKTNRKPLFLSCRRNLVDSYIKKTGESFEEEVSRFVGEFATEKDLVEASLSPFVFYGNHLFNHYVPLLMSDDELMESFVKNIDELKKYPNYRDMFSLPFGQPGSCFSERQVDLLLKNGAKKVFRSSATINYDTTASYLDRISLTSYHNSSEKIWFQIFQHRLRISL